MTNGKDVRLCGRCRFRSPSGKICRTCGHDQFIQPAQSKAVSVQATNRSRDLRRVLERLAHYLNNILESAKGLSAGMTRAAAPIRSENHRDRRI